jgi:hypothetical protein
MRTEQFLIAVLKKGKEKNEGPYLDPKGALGGLQQVPQGAPSGYFGASIRALSGPNYKP